MSRLHAVRTVVVQTPAIDLSGLAISPAERPARGLILTLHGGGCSAGYWHCPAEEGRLSLLTLAAELGFHVLAVDRPGYSASQHFDPGRLGLKDQVSFLFDAVDAWSRQLGFEGPAFVIGHSIGGILALLMAADPRSARLAAVDALGVPLAFAADSTGAEVQSWSSAGVHIAPLQADLHRRICFGPDGTFSDEAYAYDRSLIRPMPVKEYHEAISMPGIWPSVLPQITLPVQMTMADDEAMQKVGPEIARLAESLLCNSANLRIFSQPASGHNASSHHIGRAYHLRAVAFFEECLALGEQAARP
jgi:pimeloyl-ACP methyl ester carboxylesterase